LVAVEVVEEGGGFRRRQGGERGAHSRGNGFGGVRRGDERRGGFGLQQINGAPFGDFQDVGDVFGG
jgi:hypothetical protein